jgi:hypothetical protein
MAALTELTPGAIVHGLNLAGPVKIPGGDHRRWEAL